MAEEVGLDLVEIAPDANPPVCKIMDFGKYKYEMALSSTLVHDLSGASDFESLLSSAMSLHLWHIASLNFLSQ